MHPFSAPDDAAIDHQARDPKAAGIQILLGLDPAEQLYSKYTT